MPYYFYFFSLSLLLNPRFSKAESIFSIPQFSLLLFLLMLFKGLTPSFSTNFQVLFAFCELFQLLLLPFQLHLVRLLFFIKFLNFFLSTSFSSYFNLSASDFKTSAAYLRPSTTSSSSLLLISFVISYSSIKSGVISSTGFPSVFCFHSSNFFIKSIPSYFIKILASLLCFSISFTDLSGSFDFIIVFLILFLGLLSVTS